MRTIVSIFIFDAIENDKKENETKNMYKTSSKKKKKNIVACKTRLMYRGEANTMLVLQFIYIMLVIFR